MAHIFQINASRGGVPKHAVITANVATLGVEGDAQLDLVHHGGPDRALCVYSLERIVALQGEGHPIYPGAAGENLTLAGLDWDLVAPGTRLRLGETAVIEVTRYTEPCNNIKFAFKDGNSNRIHQNKHAGWSRVYAKVVQPGRIRIGDCVEMA